MDASLQEGALALANGAASFLAAAVLAGILWLLYQINKRLGFSQGLGWAFSGLDTALRRGVAHLTGATLKASWRRWPTFILFFSALAVGAAFAPAPIALGIVGFALIAVLAVYRLWERDEDKRIERRSKGKSDYEGQDMRDEMFAAIGMMLFFIPLGYVRISELTPVTSGHSPYPALDAAFFVWGELTKALPLVDWSEVYRVRNLSGVESAGTTGMSLNFFIRVLFDLLVLAGIIRTLDILRSQAQGVDLRGPEAALKSGDPARILPALDTIIAAAMKGRRNAIAHLFQITQASRGDERLAEPKWREACARALSDVAEILLEKSQDLTDLDNRLLAIEAHKTSARFMKSVDPEFWATTQNDLGLALADLGNLTGDVARLEEAVTAYRAALTVDTRDTMPAEWARPQSNLGNALAELGEMTGDVARLEEAVMAFRAVLEVRTREAMPAEWARTQSNLGSALGGVGNLTDDAARLEEAVTAHRAALEVRTREAMPAEWAATQNNLGNALSNLGKLAGDTARLEEAVTAHRAVLEVGTRDAVRSEWATTQNNLGTTLGDLGKLTGDAARLDEAVTAFRAALEVRTREALPADWAQTQYNIGIALADLGNLTGDAVRLEEAVTAYHAALEVRTPDGMPADWAATQWNLGDTLGELGNLAGDTVRLEEAVKAYRAALEVYTREALPANWAGAQNNLGIALAGLWRMTKAEMHRRQAKNVWAELADYYAARQEPDEASEYRRKIEEIDADGDGNAE